MQAEGVAAPVGGMAASLAGEGVCRARGGSRVVSGVLRTSEVGAGGLDLFQKP